MAQIYRARNSQSFLYSAHIHVYSIGSKYSSPHVSTSQVARHQSTVKSKEEEGSQIPISPYFFRYPQSTTISYMSLSCGVRHVPTSPLDNPGYSKTYLCNVLCTLGTYYTSHAEDNFKVSDNLRVQSILAAIILVYGV